MPAPSGHEFRQDRLTRTWVACAPSRSGRPQKTDDAPAPSAPPSDTPVEGCPFCPGHEDQLPAVLWERAADADRPWRTRAVPNKFSALTADAAPASEDDGLYRTRSPHGRQEVIIDTPFHHEDLPAMSPDQVDALLATYLARYRTLRAAAPTLYPFVFRNHGGRAGASIPHPHSQIIATDFPPPAIEREETAARARYEDTGRCPYCQMIDRETDAAERLVWANEHLVMFVPFAARLPYELWILPRRHEPEVERIAAAERTALGRALQYAARRYKTRLGDPAYNYFVRTALAYRSDAPHLHWSVRVQPRTSRQAGFELSTDVRINPSLPERDAAVLRGDDEASAP
jgi:UDPglucose--hexose-1-phosphate uridylyltransferase